MQDEPIAQHECDCCDTGVAEVFYMSADGIPGKVCVRCYGHEEACS